MDEEDEDIISADIKATKMMTTGRRPIARTPEEDFCPETPPCKRR